MEAKILNRAKFIMETLKHEPSGIATFGGEYFNLLKVKGIHYKNKEYSINYTYTANPYSLNTCSCVSIGSLITICDICTTVAIFAGDKDGRTTVIYYLRCLLL